MFKFPLQRISNPWSMTQTNNMNNETKTITAGNSAAVIHRQGSKVWANIYTNARNGIENADITAQSWKGSSMKGATTWANKMLAK